jgi:predicted ATPase/DNA-binding CsgD family transcriptional regulator
VAASASRQQSDNLPIELTSFVGRRQELAEARHLLVGARLVTLTGVGGVGKTRLALRLAGELRRTFPHGVRLVELAEVDEPESLVEKLGSVLGVDNVPGEDPLVAVRGFVADLQALLVLDNCEHLVEACAVLVGQLLSVSADIRVLCTSRQPLGIAGEHTFAVPPLSVPEPSRRLPPSMLDQYDAVRLFVTRAVAILPDFAVTEDNAHAVARLCQQLDGIPLAIELAAARLRAFSVTQILARLDDRYRLLTAGNRIALPRQRTLRALVDWSFGLCSAAECTLWARLSVFAGGFDLESAEGVCSGGDVPADEVFDLLAGLVDKSVVMRVDEGGLVRYRMLETIRQYGRDRLIEGCDEETRRRRHRDWFARLAEQAEAGWLGPEQVEFAERIEVENANLRLALEFCLAEPDGGQAALRLAASLCNYRRACGSLAEGRRWLERVLVNAPEPTPAKARALWVCAWLVLLQGDIDTGHDLLTQCGALADQIGDEQAAVRVTQFTGLAEVFQARFWAGIELLTEAFDRYNELGDTSSATLAYGQLTMARCFAADPGAEDAVRMCLRFVDPVDSPEPYAYVLWYQAILAFRQGRPADATESVDRAIRVRAVPRDTWLVGLCLETLGWCAAAGGAPARAAALLGAAEATRRSMGSALAGLPYLAEPHDACVRRSREVLGEKEFEDAYRSGVDMGPERALEVARSGRPTAPERAVPTQRGGDPLTRRERQIADLVAQGMSNKEIAAALVIAPRTAETHVEHILSKLGFNRRAQIAAWSAARRR